MRMRLNNYLTEVSQDSRFDIKDLFHREKQNIYHNFKNGLKEILKDCE